MIRRASISLLLGLLLASSATPSAGVIVCIAADGHVALELAVPGTARCDERDCGPHAATVDEHSCRDVPLLSSAPSMVPTTSVAMPELHALGAVPSNTVPYADRMPRPLPSHHLPVPLAADPRLGSVVLTL